MGQSVAGIGLGNEIYKRGGRTRERERTVQVQFSSGCSRCSCCSRVCIVFTLPLPPRTTLFPCFSLLFHPFRSCAPRSFPPRLSFFIDVDHVSPVFTGLIAFSRANIARLGRNRRLADELDQRWLRGRIVTLDTDLLNFKSIF